ncbi:MAG: hypothetical protein JWR05_3485 [Mucilaginibacter sp.]|nr:hypothetical protein [Mucilaginibacter sp.]
MGLLIGLASFAQKGSAVKLPLIAGDTIVNTGTTSRVIKFTGGYNGAVLQINVALASGTGAGTLTLMGSLDGVNYKTIGSAYTITNTASQSAQFTVTAPLPTFIKVAGAGSGTEVAILTYWYNDPLFQTP